MESINRRNFLKLAAGGTAGIYLSGCRANQLNGVFKPKYDQHRLAPTPPKGWNSYDCYGIVANERVIRENLEAFAKKLKPHGYEYFVIDAGWFHEFDNPPTEEFPRDWPAKHVRIDEFGRPLVSKHFFPNGLKPIIDRAHKLGIKFGLWMIRGINKKAVEQNFTIKGTKYRAADIANKEDLCPWWPDNYGVDMTKPGAQEYYNSIFELLASWEIDFVKYDDIVPHPDEIEAVANAIENCGRNITLSLSPGSEPFHKDVKSYQRANMVRITPDVWDDKYQFDLAFTRWEFMQNYGGDGFYLDLDMIPFGHLMVWNKMPPGTPPEKAGEYARMDRFKLPEKQTLMTMQALCASPLIMGGELTSTDEMSFKLITDPEMLACNQNGVTGKLAHRQPTLDIWRAPHKKKANHGWVGIFNRNPYEGKPTVTKSQMGLDETRKYKFYDIWKRKNIADAKELNFTIEPDGVVFLRYQPAGLF